MAHRRLLHVAPRPLRLGAGALLVCAVLAGCGGSSARPLVRKAIAADRSVRSGLLTFAVNLRSTPEAALGGPLRTVVQGPFESKGPGKVPAFNLRVGLVSGPATVQLAITSTGRSLYLTFGGQPFEVPASSFAALEAAYSNSGLQPSALPAGVEPLAWLENPQSAGSETIEGEAVDKVKAGLNKGRLLSSLAKVGPFSGALTELASRLPALHGILGALSEQSGRKELGEAIHRASLELAIGKRSGVLRQLKLTVDLQPTGRTQSRLGGLRSGELTVEFALSQVNAPQRIVAPSHAKPLSQLLQEAESAGLSLG